MGNENKTLHYAPSFVCHANPRKHVVNAQGFLRAIVTNYKIIYYLISFKKKVPNPYYYDFYRIKT